jgi:hypothetical protein
MCHRTLQGTLLLCCEIPPTRDESTAQRLDEIIDRQPYAECDKDHGADFEQHFGGLWIGSGRPIVSNPFGSTIPGVAEREWVPQKIAHGRLSSLSLG